MLIFFMYAMLTAVMTLRIPSVQVIVMVTFIFYFMTLISFMLIPRYMVFILFVVMIVSPMLAGMSSSKC